MTFTHEEFQMLPFYIGRNLGMYMTMDSNGVRLCSIKFNAELVLIYQSECMDECF